MAPEEEERRPRGRHARERARVHLLSTHAHRHARTRTRTFTHALAHTHKRMAHICKRERGGGWGWGGLGWYGGWYGYPGYPYYYNTVAGYPYPVGTVVTAVPANCQSIVVDGVAYYMINGVTYTQTTDGNYQAVQPPQVSVNTIAAPASPPFTSSVSVPAASLPAPASSAPAQKPAVVYPVAGMQGSEGASAKADDAFTINIPSAKGGYVPVTLKKSGSGFIGPQGEYYPEFPKVELLKAMYGK